MLDTLERAKAQCIAYYVCCGGNLSDVQNGNYEERCNNNFDKYKENCKNFADKICDCVAHYSRLDEHEREMLIDSFTASMNGSLTDLSLIYCELGMRIGFTMALDLGLDNYKEKRGV